MKTNTIELYIHIPFCKSKCRYCDFCSFRAEEETIHAYLGKLKEELIFWGKKLAARDVVTVFIGGGTPSYLRREDIQMICETIFEHFHICEDAEITIEANPGTVDLKKLCTYRENGINRISFGLQSTVKEELEYLGRIHTYEEFLQSFDWARQAGFLNINVDLMSAVPKQTLTSYEENLRKIAKLSPEHISAYSLIIEEGTPFYEDNKLEELLPSEEDEVLMYRMTEKILNEYGYDKYEISNYAKPGYECRHNIVYWTMDEYIGIGIGAASFFNGRRYSNTSDIKQYVDTMEEVFEKRSIDEAYRIPELLSIRHIDEAVDIDTLMEEYVIFGLRMTRGISAADFYERFGHSLYDAYGDIIRGYVASGHMKDEKGMVCFTRKGIDVSNRILVDFLQDKDK